MIRTLEQPSSLLYGCATSLSLSLLVLAWIRGLEPLAPKLHGRSTTLSVPLLEWLEDSGHQQICLVTALQYFVCLYE